MVYFFLDFLHFEFDKNQKRGSLKWGAAQKYMVYGR